LHGGWSSGDIWSSGGIWSSNWGIARGGDSHPLSFDTRGLPGQLTEVVQFGAAYFTSRYDLDFINSWRMEWENTFNAYPVGNFSYSESGSVASVRAANDSALEHLNPFLIAFDNLGVNP
jgi:hypothetical protein